MTFVRQYFYLKFEYKFYPGKFVIGIGVISWLNQVLATYFRELQIPNISLKLSPAICRRREEKSVSGFLVTQCVLREEESSWEALGGYYQIDSFSLRINVL